jgi:hypothetical protein
LLVHLPNDHSGGVLEAAEGGSGEEAPWIDRQVIGITVNDSKGGDTHLTQRQQVAPLGLAQCDVLLSAHRQNVAGARNPSISSRNRWDNPNLENVIFDLLRVTATNMMRRLFASSSKLNPTCAAIVRRGRKTCGKSKPFEE